MKFASLRPHLAFWALRAAWVLAVTLWALALVPWFKTPPPAREPAAAAPRIARAASDAAPAPLVAASAQPEPVQLARNGADAPAGAERRPDVVCGFNDTSATAAASENASPAARAAFIARQTGLGLQQAVDHLRTRSEPLAQGAGWWLRVLIAREGAADAPSQPCTGSDCPPPLPPLPASIEALGQLAQTHTDPWLQKAAQRACAAAPPTSAVCANVGARRWSQLEADNAAAWLELANRETAAADEALFALARTTRYDTYRGRLATWVLQAMPDSVPALQRHAAWQRADEWERASDSAALAGAQRHCTDTAKRDANRAPLCEAAARWLVPDPRAAVTDPLRSLDCASLERHWREARDAAVRGARVATQGSTPQRP